MAERGGLLSASLAGSSMQDLTPMLTRGEAVVCSALSGLSVMQQAENHMPRLLAQECTELPQGQGFAPDVDVATARTPAAQGKVLQIGRASCRERVGQYG